MFERDYLMRLILGYFQTITIVIRRGTKEKDPEGAADLLEQAIGQATEIDADVLLSLSPESIAGILQVSGTDPKVIAYVAHGLLLESHYLMMAYDFARAELREQQARALADAYGIDLPDDPAEAERLLYEAAEQGLMDAEESGSSLKRSDDGAEYGAGRDTADWQAGDGASEEVPEEGGGFAEGVLKARDAAYYRDADPSTRFDPDAPLMQPEQHQPGSFGWQK